MKTIIDKKNKLWKWSKPDKQFKDWYKKTYGLDAKEVGTMTDEAWSLYEKILGVVQ
jgi:hypothetical protein